MKTCTSEVLYILEASPLQVPPWWLVSETARCPSHPLQSFRECPPKKADEEGQGEALGHGIVPKVLRIVQGDLTIKAEALTQNR